MNEICNWYTEDHGGGSRECILIPSHPEVLCRGDIGLCCYPKTRKQATAAEMIDHRAESDREENGV